MDFNTGLNLARDLTTLLKELTLQISALNESIKLLNDGIETLNDELYVDPEQQQQEEENRNKIVTQIADLMTMSQQSSTIEQDKIIEDTNNLLQEIQTSFLNKT